MQDYIYEETKYIKRQDLNDFRNMMSDCDYMPEEIQDENEFNIVFHYILNLTKKAPDFLPAYEVGLRMADCLEPSLDTAALQSDLTILWVNACEKIAEKEKIYEKQIPWGFMENRPLIRGLYTKAEALWKGGVFDEANKRFSMILKTNENDNVGARYSVKATAEKMKYKEFEKRFTTKDGTGYNITELSKWFGD